MGLGGQGSPKSNKCEQRERGYTFCSFYEIVIIEYP